jgi:hypothetical protein
MSAYELRPRNETRRHSHLWCAHSVACGTASRTQSAPLSITRRLTAGHTTLCFAFTTPLANREC